MADSNEASSTAKQLIVAELTYDQFCALFKKLFSESMNELKQEINDKVQELKGECDNKIEAIRIKQDERIEELKGELHEVRVENEELEKQNAGLQDELAHLRNETKNNFRGILEIHQDANRNSLKITGVPESPVKRNPVTQRMIPENTEEVVKNFMKDKMGISIEETDLDSAVRIKNSGKQQDSGAPQPIVVKFTRHSTRQKVISNRRCLKGTGIGVHEVLTKGFQYIYDQARTMAKTVDKVKSVWTWNGITYVLAEDEVNTYKYKIRSIQDINDVAKKHSNTSKEVTSMKDVASTKPSDTSEDAANDNSSE